MLLIFSSSLSDDRSLPGIQRIWNARSRIVSRGPGGVDALGEMGAMAEAILLLPRVWEDSVEERPWADVQPSINWLSYPDVDAGDGRSVGNEV